MGLRDFTRSRSIEFTLSRYSEGGTFVVGCGGDRKVFTMSSLFTFFL